MHVGKKFQNDRWYVWWSPSLVGKTYVLDSESHVISSGMTRELAFEAASKLAALPKDEAPLKAFKGKKGK